MKKWLIGILLCLTLGMTACEGAVETYDAAADATADAMDKVFGFGEDAKVEPEQAPAQATEQPPAEQPLAQEPATEAAPAEETGGVTPEFKEAIDSYEAFAIEYCDFMKNYSTAEDQTELWVQHVNYMQQYAIVIAKMSTIDVETLSSADYQYYSAAKVRIYEKLKEGSEYTG